MSEEFRKTLINQRWTLKLPEHRAARPLWDHWERDALAYLHAIIRPGDVVYDVGSEEGDLSALYASWGAHVVMIEASPPSWVWSRLTFDQNNLRSLGAVQALAGPRVQGEPRYFHAEWPEGALGEEHPDFGFRHLSEAIEEHPITTLDEVARHFRPPNVVVMDIEGSEYQALLGAQTMLKHQRPIWMISVHAEFLRERYGDTPDDLLCMFELAGYDTFKVSYDHEAHYLFKP